MSEATPRITAAYLEQFQGQGQTVRVVGRVTQLRGDHAVIDAGGSITVYLTRVSLDNPNSDRQYRICQTRRSTFGCQPFVLFTPFFHS